MEGNNNKDNNMFRQFWGFLRGLFKPQKESTKDDCNNDTTMEEKSTKKRGTRQVSKQENIKECSKAGEGHVTCSKANSLAKHDDSFEKKSNGESKVEEILNWIGQLQKDVSRLVGLFEDKIDRLQKDVESSKMKLSEKIDQVRTDVILAINTSNNKTAIQKLSNDIEQLQTDYKGDNQELQSSIQTLSNICTAIQKQFDDEDNVKINDNEKKYRKALDEIGEIIKDFRPLIPKFKRRFKLEVVEKLVQYFYMPTEDLKQEFSEEQDATFRALLKRIEKFDSDIKPAFEEILKTKGTSWNECVKFPKQKFFDSELMDPFSQYPTPNPNQSVYVVSIGALFPDSNSGIVIPSKPQVIAKEIKTDLYLNNPK